MIRIRSRRLPDATLTGLERYQAHVNSAPTYEGQVERAKAHFKAKNRPEDPVFRVVRALLDAMCCGPRRCMYCEDAPADEVEHFRPKDLHPELAFAWTNYLYACGSCNGPKNNRFAVIAGGATPNLIDATRKRGAQVIPPPKGKPALINPLKEDPIQFFQLDLLGTFEFVPTALAGSLDYLRAEYTLDVLRLNDRDYLIKARESAFFAFDAILNAYLGKRETGASKKTLSHFRNAIRRSHHQTVWAEMKRQHATVPLISPLFLEAPEALNW
jgi:uncharacterized protein (TIGR02646 family)